MPSLSHVSCSDHSMAPQYAAKADEDFEITVSDLRRVDTKPFVLGEVDQRLAGSVRLGTNRVPLCCSRQTMSDETKQARIDSQSGGVLTALTVVSCAAAFVIAYAGWGF